MLLRQQTEKRNNTKRMKKALVLAPLILSILLLGCSEKVKVGDTEIPVIHIEDQSEAIVTGENYIPIDIIVANRCGVTIGMLSIIEPKTGEQLNLSGIDDGNALSISINWPKQVTKLKWALYNINGELCVESESNIEGVTKSVVIDISGDGDADDINVTIE